MILKYHIHVCCTAQSGGIYHLLSVFVWTAPTKFTLNFFVFVSFFSFDESNFFPNYWIKLNTILVEVFDFCAKKREKRLFGAKDWNVLNFCFINIELRTEAAKIDWETENTQKSKKIPFVHSYSRIESIEREKQIVCVRVSSCVRLFLWHLCVGARKPSELLL